jgi:hypothetical protein
MTPPTPCLSGLILKNDLPISGMTRQAAKDENKRRDENAGKLRLG